MTTYTGGVGGAGGGVGRAVGGGIGSGLSGGMLGGISGGMFGNMFGGGAAVTIQPCSFTLDVEWARSIIDRLSQGLERIGSAIRKGIEMFSKGVQKVLSWFPDFLIPPFIKVLIRKGLDLLGKVAQKAYQLEARVVSTLKQLLGPWEIRSAGQNIVEGLAPKTSQFADSMQKSQLASSRSWQSDAASDFFHAVDRQHEAATGAAEATKTFGTSVKSLGDQAVSTTVSFITDYVSSVAQIVIAAVGLPTVFGTPAAATAIIGLAGKIIAALVVLVKSAMSIAQQARSFATTAAGAVPGGKWPDDTRS